MNGRNDIRKFIYFRRFFFRFHNHDEDDDDDVQAYANIANK